MSIVETEKQLQQLKAQSIKKQKELEEYFSQEEIRLAAIKKEIALHEKSIKTTSGLILQNLDENIDKEKLIRFLNKPYVTKSFGQNKLLVFVPKWVPNFQVGWLLEERDEYYVYELNQYSNWFGDIPEDLQKQIQLQEGIPATVQDDIIQFDPQDKDKIKKAFPRFVTDFTDSTARITKGHTFEIIAEIIESGRLPFKKKPVEKQDMREGPKTISLLEHQKEAWQTFLETGAIGVFLPTGGGKSFIAMKALESIKGPHLVITYGTALVQQWNWYIEKYIPHMKDQIQVVHYQTAYNLQGPYSVTVYDECHRLPAPTFSRFSFIKTKYRLGLSASPHREDKNEKLIVTLTGQPVGTNWPKYMETVGRKYHPVFVHVVKALPQKWAKLKSLYNPNRKTIVFSDSLELGRRASQILNIPFVSGETQEKLALIQANKSVILSRVGDMGISIPDLERIIEIDFQFGSRQQEIQRTGRLMHSQAQNTRHDIIMTEQEFSEYGKRLWILQEKGFKIKIVENGN